MTDSFIFQFYLGMRPECASNPAEYARRLRNLGFQDSGVPAVLLQACHSGFSNYGLKLWGDVKLSVWLPLEKRNKWIQLKIFLWNIEKIKLHALIKGEGIHFWEDNRSLLLSYFLLKAPGFWVLMAAYTVIDSVSKILNGIIFWVNRKVVLINYVIIHKT